MGGAAKSRRCVGEVRGDLVDPATVTSGKPCPIRARAAAAPTAVAPTTIRNHKPNCASFPYRSSPRRLRYETLDKDSGSTDRVYVGPTADKPTPNASPHHNRQTGVVGRGVIQEGLPNPYPRYGTAVIGQGFDSSSVNLLEIPVQYRTDSSCNLRASDLILPGHPSKLFPAQLHGACPVLRYFSVAYHYLAQRPLCTNYRASCLLQMDARQALL